MLLAMKTRNVRMYFPDILLRLHVTYATFTFNIDLKSNFKYKVKFSFLLSDTKC